MTIEEKNFLKAIDDVQKDINEMKKIISNIKLNHIIKSYVFTLGEQGKKVV